jgi:DNA-binding NarL/FixJ family response regulator
MSDDGIHDEPAPRAASPTRVLLADDHTLVRAGVRRILEGHPDFQVVGEVADGEAALRALEHTETDVLVLDLSMQGHDGFEVLRETRRRWPRLRVIVLTMHTNSEYIARAVREGAYGYLLKDSAVQDLVSAIRAVTAGHEYFSPPVQQELARMLREPSGPPRGIELLTEREREVLKMVAAGLATKEIAARLFISTRTVETHRANLMRKLDLHSVAKLTQFAIREGMVEGH